MRNIWVSGLFLLLTATGLFSNNEIAGITTTLVIMEEQENDTFVINATPFTDGIFDALWQKEYIFFDMRITEPITIVYNQLDVKPFLETARQSGADSILLIKFHYNVEKEGNNYRLTADEIVYHLYSLSSMKTLRVGRKELHIDQIITRAEKNPLLRKIGFSMLNDIYD